MMIFNSFTVGNDHTRFQKGWHYVICIRLIPALVVEFRVFLAALSKVFRKASLSLMKEQFSRMAKSAASNIFSYFVSLRATRVKKTDPGLETKRLDIASFVVGSNKSLALQSRF